MFEPLYLENCVRVVSLDGYRHDVSFSSHVQAWLTVLNLIGNVVHFFHGQQVKDLKIKGPCSFWQQNFKLLRAIPEVFQCTPQNTLATVTSKHTSSKRKKGSINHGLTEWLTMLRCCSYLFCVQHLPRLLDDDALVDGTHTAQRRWVCLHLHRGLLPWNSWGGSKLQRNLTHRPHGKAMKIGLIVSAKHKLRFDSKKRFLFSLYGLMMLPHHFFVWLVGSDEAYG